MITLARAAVIAGIILRLSIVLALLAGTSAPASGEVVRVEIRTREAIGTSGYEKIVGRVTAAVDPRHPANAVIADLDKTATNAAGRVEFFTDLYLIQPVDPAKRSGVVIVDVPNRGYPLILQHMNGAPGRLDFTRNEDLGDGFLMRGGFTLAWIGWQGDLPRNGRLLGADLPRAAGIEGIVKVEFTPNDANPTFTLADVAGYPPADADGPDTVLTVRAEPFARATIVARDRYQLRGNVVTMAGGFEPGRIYELSFRSRDPIVAGLGLAAVRDVTSWLRYGADSPVSARYVYGYGVSQTGRFLRAFLYDGFNRDERGRIVFDAVMPVGAGAARLSVNERWAQPNGNAFYGSATFPFADVRQRNPVSGRSDGLLEGERGIETAKIFYVNSAAEYWGVGRSAALTHTTADGTSDVAPPANVRIYAFASASHSPGPVPPRVTQGQAATSPVVFALRGLMMALERWVRQGTEPPHSQYPRLADRSLVRSEDVTYPAIPGMASPGAIPAGREGNTVLPLLVSQVDEDGNDRAGIRLPAIAVPLGTYTGWNFRNASIGGTSTLMPFIGSFVPFAATKASRETTGDPRKAIDERYPSRDEYLTRIRAAADALVREGILVADDVTRTVNDATTLWDSIVSK